MKKTPIWIIIVLIIAAIFFTRYLAKRNDNNHVVPKTNSDSVINSINQKELDRKLKLLKKRKEIFKKLRLNYDDIEQNSWYYDKNTKNTIGNQFYIYFLVNREDQLSARVSLSYYSDDWLFIERFIIKTGKYTFYVNETTDDGIRDVIDGGGVYEKIDLVLDKNWEKVFDAISKSKSVKLRYEGKDYFHDRVLSDSERSSLVRMYKYYKEIR